MESGEPVKTTEFVNPVASEQPPPYESNYNVQQTGDGELQTVVVVAPPPGAVVTVDPFEEELQKTSNCAWATLGSCFFPISIVALIFTCKAKDAYKAGNKEEAERYDSMATKLSWSSCLIGMVLYIIGISVYIYFRTKYT